MGGWYSIIVLVQLSFVWMFLHFTCSYGIHKHVGRLVNIFLLSCCYILLRLEQHLSIASKLYHYACTCSNARMVSNMCWLTTVTQEGEVLWGFQLMKTVALTCTMMPLSSHTPHLTWRAATASTNTPQSYQLYFSCTIVLEPEPLNMGLWFCSILQS